jgi:hypothetical protein
MLTCAALAAFCEEGLLRQWTPRPSISTQPSGRVLLMFPEVYDRFEKSPWPGSDGENPRRTRQRRSAMRIVLERYCDGRFVNLRYDIKELGSEPVQSRMRGF